MQQQDIGTSAECGESAVPDSPIQNKEIERTQRELLDVM
jgi:hypothetical protein